jgi:hypothetical protein
VTTSESGRVSEAIAAVERQIAGLWAPEHGASPKSRACTANVVFATAAHDVRDAVHLATSLTTADLARTFVVHLDPKLPPWGIEASVSAHCQKGEAGVVCAERIDLALGTMTYARAASIIDALAVSEVPTVLVVASAAPTMLVSTLTRAASRVIVDADALGLAQTHALAGETEAHFVDLAWQRLYPWRNQIARCFDDPAVRPAVSAIRSVQITAAGEGSGGRRLLGWLAARLGWRFTSPTEAVDPRHGRIAIDFHTRECDAPAWAVLGVEITASLADGDAAFTLLRHGDPPRIDTTWHAQGAGHGTRSAPIVQRSLADHVDRAIADAGCDDVLRASLDAAYAYPSTGVAA